MKIHQAILVILLHPLVLQGLSLEEMNISYKAKILTVNETRAEAVESLQEKYQRALTQYQKSFQDAGKLNPALLVKEESERIKKGTWPLPALPKELENKVGGARGIYIKTYVGIERKWAVATSKAAETMLELLNDKKVELTKAGKLEEAKKVGESIVAINEDATIVRARELPGRLTESGRSKAAFVLRRPGDDLEVLVRYDSSGKVSMKSPVINVVEQTGGRREKGDTTAKTLGEFVGADGFEGDPYISYDGEAKGGKIEFSEFVGSAFNKQVKYGDEMAARVEIKKNAKNAYFNLKGVLSDHPGVTHRVTFDYLIPESNKKVIGLNLQQGGASGKPIGRQHEVRGKWTTGVCESPSSAAYDFITIYFRGPSFKEFAASGGDQIYFKTFKVEYIRFPAFIVESFGKSGDSTERNTSLASQKLLINNGAFLPK